MLAGWAATAIPFTIWWAETRGFISVGVLAFAIGLPIAMTIAGMAAGVGGIFGSKAGTKAQNRGVAAAVGGGVGLIAGVFVMALLADKGNWGCVGVIGFSSMIGGVCGGWAGVSPQNGERRHNSL
jgi:hypothetical protein